MRRTIFQASLSFGDVVGLWRLWGVGTREQVANLTYYGLYALQHRGQESAGMAVGNGQSLLVRTRDGPGQPGLRRADPATLQGHLAIGHTRYPAPAGRTPQPAFKTNAAGGGIALAQNGNFTDTAALARQLILRESPPSWPLQAAHGSSDTDVMADLLAREADLSLEAMTEAAGGARGVCTACFTGDYPIPVDAPPHGTGLREGAPQAGHRRHAGAAW